MVWAEKYSLVNSKQTCLNSTAPTNDIYVENHCCLRYPYNDPPRNEKSEISRFIRNFFQIHSKQVVLKFVFM